MTALTDRTINSTYTDLLQVSNSGNGVDASLRNVSDGEGTASALELSTTSAKIQGDLVITGDLSANTVSGSALGNIVTAATAAQVAASSSATAAATSATDASNSAASSAASAANSATSESNSATSAAASATSAAASASSASSAAADLATFQGQYHGASASEPTTGLDVGDLWFDSVANAMKVYDGSSWVAAYISAAGTLTAANNLSDVSSASASRTNLGLGSLATQAANSVAITGGSISGITDLAVADGGTGASTASVARTNLGLAIGTDVQAYDAGLNDIAGLAVTDGNFVVGDGSNWVAESGATARTSLGLGTMATAAAADYLALAGGTMTGALQLGGDLDANGKNINVTNGTDPTGDVTDGFALFSKDINGNAYPHARPEGGSNVPIVLTGKQSVWLPARAFLPRDTNGAEAATRELATNDVMLESLNFDAATKEYAQLELDLPKDYNGGTITVNFKWTAGSGSGDVVWGLQAVCVGNDDALDVAMGTAQTVTDTLTAVNDLCETSETSAITISAAAAQELCIITVYRDAAAGGDTLAVDAELIGVRLTFTTDLPNED